MPGGSRQWPGDAGKEPSAHLLAEQSNACSASCIGCRFPQPLLGWRASATVCPAAAMVPPGARGSLPFPSRLLRLAEGPAAPGDRRGGCQAAACWASRQRGFQSRARVAEPVADGRWAKMLRVKECSKRSLLVVSVNAGAEGWLWPRRKRDWTGRRRQSCLLSSE